jgi:hypothetical protein
MSQEDSEFWEKAYRARDKLVQKFLHHPNVSLIDIGLAPDQDTGTESIVLRIHIKEGWKEADENDQISFPKQIEGIPVVVVLGDYRLTNC